MPKGKCQHSCICQEISTCDRFAEGEGTGDSVNEIDHQPVNPVFVACKLPKQR